MNACFIFIAANRFASSNCSAESADAAHPGREAAVASAGARCIAAAAEAGAAAKARGRA